MTHITKRQADILRLLSGGDELHSAAVVDSLKMLRSQHKNIAYNLNQLADNYLVEVAEPRATVPGSMVQVGRKYAITDMGKDALRGFSEPKAIAVQATKTPAPSINYMKLPVYAPPRSGYVRNTGHSNLQSRGACV